MSPRNWHEKTISIRKKGTATGAPDAKILFTKIPFLQYEQFFLDKNFRLYLEPIIVSRNCKKGCSKNTYPKTYEISVGSDTINVDFLSSNIQFD